MPVGLRALLVQGEQKGSLHISDKLLLYRRAL